jgi:hypothetical protein
MTTKIIYGIPQNSLLVVKIIGAKDNKYQQSELKRIGMKVDMVGVSNPYAKNANIV